MARAAPLPGQTTSKPLPVNYLYTPHHATKWVSLLEIFAPHPPPIQGGLWKTFHTPIRDFL